ncbi:hypothetical protein RHMOL_Rhmol03G0050200 [Rhododendron molle]|uniref:Uncharacterized protein n=1 Tax=Rhododendron molle TaxID=49168 RepID=A0ACC0PBU0_RHOML|nr:hypothetical protein RHMOL_Rhmol03G0050200 [Rhododendron molle]
MRGVFIGHLGLGQAQDGAPMKPRHVSPCTSRSWRNSSSSGIFSKGELESPRHNLHPKPSSHKKLLYSRWSKVANRDDCVLILELLPDAALRSG